MKCIPISFMVLPFVSWSDSHTHKHTDVRFCRVQLISIRFYIIYWELNFETNIKRKYFCLKGERGKRNFTINWMALIWCVFPANVFKITDETSTREMLLTHMIVYEWYARCCMVIKTINDTWAMAIKACASPIEF